MLDFNRLNRSNVKKEIDPRDIFMSLPSKSAEYSYLRDVQSEVLQQWYLNRDKTNNIIKMNTGSGKTVVALLALQSSLNEGIGNAVYVVPDQYLVHQVMAEARNLGIKTVDSETNLDFLSRKAILVINIHKLVNGRSVFGLRGINDVPLDTVLIDDVHSCIETINNQYTLNIKGGTDTYTNILNVLSMPIKLYSSDAHYHLYENTRQFFDFYLPFWIWQDKCNDIKRILVEADDDEKDKISFALPLIEDSFSTCNCVISEKNIEITSKLINIDKIKSFSNAKRRIFMSATLFDDTVFYSTLGLRKDTIESVITPQKANDIGERLMLFPEFMNPEIEKKDIKQKLIELSKKYNVVVIVPTYDKANFWKDCAQQVLSVSDGNLESGINDMKSHLMGLTVIVNKYDGIDLPNGACRVLVIDDLPNVSSMYDRVVQSVNSNDSNLLRKQVQKIEQGIGRGVRSNIDYCVVIFTGSKLVNSMITRSGISFFSSATLAQYELSSLIWEQISNEEKKPTVDEIFALTKYVLERDVNWIRTSKERLNDIKYNKSLNYDGIATIVIDALMEHRNRNTIKAIKLLNDLSNESTNRITKGQITHLIAELTNFSDKVKAQEILKSGYKLNNNITKPIDGIEFTKNINLSKQPDNIIKYISENNIKSTNEYLLNIKELSEDLVFMPNTSESFEETLKNLFNAIGFSASRPEKEFKTGPDNLVALGNGKYLIIECKNEAVNSLISKEYTNQLNGSINWFKTKYEGDDYTYVPVLIHKSNIFNYDASPDPTTRIIDEELIQKICNRIREFAINLQHTFEPFSSSSLSRLLGSNKLTANDIVELYTKTFKKKNV